MKSSAVTKVEVRRQWAGLQALPVRHLPVFEAFVAYADGSAVTMEGVHGLDSTDKLAITRLREFLDAVKKDSPKAVISLSERAGNRPYQVVEPSRWFVD